MFYGLYKCTDSLLIIVRARGAGTTTSNYQFQRHFAQVLRPPTKSAYARKGLDQVCLAHATLWLPAERKWRKCEQRSVSSAKPIMRRRVRKQCPVSVDSRPHHSYLRNGAADESFERRFSDSRRRRNYCSRLYRNYRRARPTGLSFTMGYPTGAGSSVTIAVGHTVLPGYASARSWSRET